MLTHVQFEIVLLCCCFMYSKEYKKIRGLPVLGFTHLMLTWHLFLANQHACFALYHPKISILSIIFHLFCLLNIIAGDKHWRVESYFCFFQPKSQWKQLTFCFARVIKREIIERIVINAKYIWHHCFRLVAEEYPKTSVIGILKSNA